MSKKCPYNIEALEAELPRLEEQKRLFEDKAKELSNTILQYKIWIAELNYDNKK